MAVTWALVWKVLAALVLILPVTAYVAGRVAGPPLMSTLPVPAADSSASEVPRHPGGPSSPRHASYMAASPRSSGSGENGGARVAPVPQRPHALRHESPQRHHDRHTARIRDTIRVVPDRPGPGTRQNPLIVLPEAPATATPTDTTPVVPEAPAPTPTGADSSAEPGDLGYGSSPNSDGSSPNSDGSSPNGSADSGIVPIAP